MTDLFGAEPEYQVEHEPASRRDRRQTPSGGGSPQRDPRSRRRGSVASFVMMVAILVGLAAVGWFLVRPMFTPDTLPTTAITDFPGPGTGEVTVEIPEGSTGAAIGLVLKDAGVVATAEAFSGAYNANSAATGIRPGSYTLPQQMKASDAVLALLDPNRRVDVGITIPEGYNTGQIYARVADITGLSLEEVTAAAHDFAAFGLEGPPNANEGVLDPMEGWFYPATYSLAPGADVTSLFKQMYDRTIAELDKLGVTPENRLHVLTVGSIAIKEAYFEEDFAKVTRVIENRLLPENLGITPTLGMDSTLTYAYAITNPGEKLDPNAHNADPSPFNTRLAQGLPPSPIGSVDSRLMAAAVAPEEGNWLFFVSTDLCSGVTTFVDTYDEFLPLQAQFREWNVRYVDGGSVCPIPEG